MDESSFLIRDFSDQCSLGVDLIYGVAGGSVDKDRSEGGVSGEFKCVAAHGGVVRETGTGEIVVLYM